MAKVLNRDPYILFAGGGDVSPISIVFDEAIQKRDARFLEVLRRLFLRALNENQRFILKSLANNKRRCSLNSFLEDLSVRENKPISTLKLNAKILRDLGLIEYNGWPRLTREGRLVLEVIGDAKDGRDSSKYA